MLARHGDPRPTVTARLTRWLAAVGVPFMITTRRADFIRLAGARVSRFAQG